MLEMMPLTEARRAFLQLAQRVEKGLSRYVLTKHGRPVAVLLGYEEYRRLAETARIAANSRLMQSLPGTLADLKQGKGAWLDETET